MHSFKLKGVSWNVLADGMSSNEFITNGGDEVNVLWTSRFPRICRIMQRFFEDGVQVVGLQENDHPYSILNELKKYNTEIKCVHLLAKDAARSADKLCLSSIFDYLNRTDEQFHKITESSTSKDSKDFDGLYSRMNDWYKTNTLEQIRKHSTITSFKEENAELLQKVLHRSPDDLYVVNDGCTIYYDSSVLEFVESLSACSMAKTECPTIFTGHDLGCRFKILENKSNVTPNKEHFLNVICSHLKSGEGPENENRRSEQMRSMLRALNKEDMPSVILVDSNTSDLYRKDIEKTEVKDAVLVDNVIHEEGFQNIIPSKHNECFKMRHARGAQQNKFGNIMFDTIDKILIKPEFCSDYKCVKPSWVKTLPNEYYEEVLSWRTNDDKRNELKTICCDRKWGDDMNENDVSGSHFDRNIFLHLYPNQEMPSDHPPVMAEITFTIR